MKISDLIGELVDIFGNPRAEKPHGPEIGGSDTEIVNRPDVHVVVADVEDHTEPSKMVAPLQQKLELLKRAVGVENIYNDDQDELNQILKIAGVPTASIFDAGDDEPLDS